MLEVVSRVYQSSLVVICVFEETPKKFWKMLIYEILEIIVFNRKRRSDKGCRPGTHYLEVETSCIKQVKEKLSVHHLAGLENFAQNLKE